MVYWKKYTNFFVSGCYVLKQLSTSVLLKVVDIYLFIYLLLVLVCILLSIFTSGAVLGRWCFFLKFFHFFKLIFTSLILQKRDYRGRRNPTSSKRSIACSVPSWSSANTCRGHMFFMESTDSVTTPRKKWGLSEQCDGTSLWKPLWCREKLQVQWESEVGFIPQC